ncbi:hypothetical protein CYMTET_45161 [Cymbomonas tetramitiformis]|uniref:Uncharacterized protein n=1 Tax=Cymbomonas tetramitiformis TaxID=36881 RepID=A0AAE0EZY8_9CHLO|nr:hypothetical protein CYMTET_45161 [Cymbomonas tetramitiformis]
MGKKSKRGTLATAPNSSATAVDSPIGMDVVKDSPEEEVVDPDCIEGDGKMSAKEKRRALMQAKRLHSVQVAKLKESRYKLSKKDYVQKAERKVLTQQIKALVEAKKDSGDNADGVEQEVMKLG